jgi:hypothetical protein
MECATGLERKQGPISDEQNITSPATPVNGQGQIRWSPLEAAKAIIPDLFTLATELHWPIETTGSNFAWYRGNTDTPSLSIKEDGVVWYDFKLGQGGGPIELLGVVEKLDRRSACRRFIDISAVIQRKMTHEQRMAIFSGGAIVASLEAAESRALDEELRRESESVDRREYWARSHQLRSPDDDDIARIINSRRWPESAALGLKHATDLRLLFRSDGYCGSAIYVVTDSSRRSAKIRRLDGCEIHPGRKTTSMPGSSSRWPLGTASVVRGDDVILVEGETDQLAMFSLIAIYARASLARTIVISLSAGTGVHDEALHRIKLWARLVTVIADEDEAGRAAVVRWTEQLTDAGVSVRTASVADVAEDVKDVSDLLSKLKLFPNLSGRLDRWVQSITEARKQGPTHDQHRN